MSDPREPGWVFLETARRIVSTLVRGDPKIEQLRAQGAFVCQPMSDLNEAERQTSKTLHDFFANAINADAIAVVVLKTYDETVAEEAYREAALGMMDNLVYR